MSNYIELHAASAFSFLDGASTPEALVDRAADLGYSTLALLDRDGVYGAPRFHQAARAAGLKAIVGAELTMAPFNPQSNRPSAIGNRQCAGLWLLPVLVESREGYRNLCRLVTRMKLRAPTSLRQGYGGPPELQRRRKGEGALTLEDLEGRTAGLVALAGRAALAGGRYGVGGLVDRLVGLFGRAGVFVEIERHLRRDEASDTQALLDLASAFHVPVVATNGVRFAAPDARPLYDVLTCIRHKTTLARAGRRLSVNAERYLKPPEAMARLFADLPRAVAETRELAERLAFTLADLGYRFPDYPVPEGETQASFLRKIAEVGARERYRPYHERARRQIARELDLIEKLDLAGYFLIVWDIVNFCRQQGILAQGRGSAANSAVCYSLGITAVDPVGMDLLFERFLSEERGEWPDIDLDLPSGDRREQVIQHVYEKYGRHGAAMTANVITYRGRSAAREVGKALDLEPEPIDRLAKVMNHFEWIDPADSIDRHLREAGFAPDDPTIRRFAELWRRIQDLPRHLGQHSGGMVICQGRLDEVVPLENASMPGRVVVQWDKDDCADLGIVKVDLLGLGMMAVLQDALETINAGARGQGPEAGDGAEGAGVLGLGTRGARSGAGRWGPRERRAWRGAGGPAIEIRPCALAPRRPRRLPDAAGGRHDWRLPGRVARADGHAAASPSGVLLRHRRRGGADPARADRGADGAPVSQAAAGARARDLSAPRARADPEAHAGRAALPGAAAADGDGGGGLLGRRGRGAPARVRVQALGRAHEDDRGEAARRHGAAGPHGRGGRVDRAVDRLVRALRLSRVARGELRAARLRQRLPEGALPGGVLRRDARQLSDGVLSPRDAREGRAAARRALRADRRAALALALDDRGRRRRPPRPALRRRAEGRGGHGD